ncbi:MAG: osmoprotectant transport system substrate-binding protein [Solirubrobacteraceae bacterium]|jgi:osmoprotectant transport system substrate-binding protein|nr:osmoprotectant transport system substrate-binding protein [Solirubrobacteraceae bacterium]
MTTRTWIRGLAAMLAVALALGVAACGSDNNKSSSTSTPSGQPGKGKPAVTLGDKNFTEQYILGELYAQALRAKGFTVKVKANIGSSEIIDKSLKSGKIDFYPEYTGVILSELAHQTKRPSDADAAYQAAKTFEEGRGFTLLPKTPFFDTDAIAVKPAYAQQNGLSTVADLKKLGAKFRLGAPPEFKTRFSGLLGLKSEYGVVPTFKPLAIGLQYKALDQGKIDGADVFTTDGALGGGKYKLLTDPKNIFGFQNVAPIVSQKVLTEQGDGFAATLNAVNAKLTTEAMQTMNAAVDLDKKKPAAVARTFLQANGLL